MPLADQTGWRLAWERCAGGGARHLIAAWPRLASALETAAALREQTTGQAETRLSDLAGREQALRGVLARLAAACPCMV